MGQRILIVDHDARPRGALAAALKEMGYSTSEAGGGEEGWVEFCKDEPAMVVTGLVMPLCDGRELLRRIRRRSDVPVIVFARGAAVDASVALFEAGADDFVAIKEKGFTGLVDQVVSAVEARRDTRNFTLLADRISGTSLAIRKCRSRIMGLAPLRVPVLVLGEEGVGRSAAVEVLHEIGSGGGDRLATLHCEGWKPGLELPRAEAIHLKGVENLSPGARAFLVDRIRELEGNRFTEGPRIFASGQALFKFSEAGASQVELQHRLGRLSVEVPSLRQRPQDIPEISNSLLDRLGSTMGRRVTLSISALAFLVARPWPGNVAQLEGFLERAIAFSREGIIPRALLVEIADDDDQGLPFLRRSKEFQEREFLLQTLRETGGNISRTAERMFRSRSAVYRLMEKHGISLASNR